MRNTPDAERWIETAAEKGVREAIAERDRPFGDYSQAPPEEQPDRSHVVEVPLEEGGLHPGDEGER
jgi:enoyl-CoA hydratase